MERILSSLNALNIKAISQACGSKLVGRKAEVIHALQQNISAFNLASDRSIRLISLDPGVVNLGVTKMLVPPASSSVTKPTVEQCYRDSINIDPKSSNPQFADATVSFLSRILGDQKSVDFVIIEQQRSRTSGGPSIPTAVLRANILEGMLFAVLRASYPHIKALSVSPKSVVNYWSKANEIGKTEKEKTKRTYAMSKAVRRELVGKWLQDENILNFSNPQTLEHLRSLEGKRDDVHDSLVQAMTWVEWRKNAYNFTKNIENEDNLLKDLSR